RLKGQRDALRSRLVDEHRTAIGEYFTRQSGAVQTALATKDASGLDGEYWQGQLAGLFGSLGEVTARMLGTAIAQQLGADDYVPMGQRFSNGMTGPGDPAGGADECAGCNCYLTFSNGA